MKKKEQFRKELSIIKQFMKPCDRILYLDEASIQYAASLKKMYAMKGHRPETGNPGGRHQQHIIAALDPYEKRLHFQLIARLKTAEFLEFLKAIVSKYRKLQRLIIVLDNA